MNPAVFFRSRSQSRHKTFTMRGQPSTPRNRTAQFAVSPTAAALASMAQSDRDPCDLDTLIQRFGNHLLQRKRENSNRKFVPDDLARAIRGRFSDLPPNMLKPAANQAFGGKWKKKTTKNTKSNFRKTVFIFGDKKKSTKKKLAANHFCSQKTGSKSFSTLMFGVIKRVRC